MIDSGTVSAKSTVYAAWLAGAPLLPPHIEVSIMKSVAIVSTALVMSALLAALSGCERQEGPAEGAGKAVDNAVERAGEQMEKAGDNIQEATTPGDK
jgi:hypothetical protein